MSPVMALELYNNSLQSWLTAGTVGVLIHLSLWLFIKFLANRLAILAKKTATDLDDFLVELLRSTHFVLLFAIAVFTASRFLELPKGPTELLKAMLVLALLTQVGVWAVKLVNFWLDRYVGAKESEQDRLVLQTMLGPMKFLVLLLMWAILLLVALDNLGVNVTALVAGLGVGGVAVALATQNILGDVFASLSIVINKPFVIGDTINVGEFTGTVEHIGLKSTRVRSISGELLIFSNNDILQSRVRNFKSLTERRRILHFGLAHGTPAEKLAEIPAILQEIIEAEAEVRFDRAHFMRISAASYDFEAIYFVLSPDYNTYMDIQQRINLALLQRLEKEEVAFAVVPPAAPPIPGATGAK